MFAVKDSFKVSELPLNMQGNDPHLELASPNWLQSCWVSLSAMSKPPYYSNIQTKSIQKENRNFAKIGIRNLVAIQKESRARTRDRFHPNHSEERTGREGRTVRPCTAVGREDACRRAHF